MTADQLTDLKRLEAAATPGPWGVPGANVLRLYSWSDRDPVRCIVNDAMGSAFWGRDEIKWPDTEEAANEAAANVRLISFLRNSAPNLLRAAEVVAACERWGIGARKFGSGRWGPEFVDDRTRSMFWNRQETPAHGYATFSDAVLAAAAWLEAMEGKQ